MIDEYIVDYDEYVGAEAALSGMSTARVSRIRFPCRTT